MDRREFVTFLSAGGFALALAPPGRAATTATLSPWIAIAPDGRVTLTSTALEMGQGSRTGQAQVLACELNAVWESVTVVQAPETKPFLSDGALYSGGSETLKTRYEQMRLAAATARFQLTAAAARRWGVEPSTCSTHRGEVIHAASGRRLGYGALAAEAAQIPPPKDPPLKPIAERCYIGQSLPTLDQIDKVTGAARYGVDFRLPGMLFATIRQCPTFGGTLAGVDEAPALKVRGVTRVVRLKDAVAVVASSTWAALKGARALEPRWTGGASMSSPAIRSALVAGADSADAVISPRDGGKELRDRVRAAHAAAPRRHEAAYELAYLAHATMEPMNATARPTGDGGVEVWAPAQSPTWLRDETAAMAGLRKEQVKVHCLLMGGGFGRRGKGDYGGRAAQVALAIGAPVQVLWTREEDMAHDFYRPAMRVTQRAGLDAEGRLLCHEAVAATTEDLTGAQGPRPYRLPLHVSTLSNIKTGVPIGAWRAVDPGMALFGRESFVDECALLAGADPLAYREAMLGDNPRALRVLRLAAGRIGWTSPRAAGVGRGIALLDAWDTLVAQAVEVRVEGQKLRVIRMVAAVDCGTAVNPQQVRAQFEGGGLMALSAALGEQVTITDGRADQTNFTDYPILRISQAPAVEVILLDSPEATVGGVGEPPVPGVAPALANAVFQATGRRIRTLPFTAAGFEV